MVEHPVSKSPRTLARALTENRFARLSSFLFAYAGCPVKYVRNFRIGLGDSTLKEIFCKMFSFLVTTKYTARLDEFEKQAAVTFIIRYFNYKLLIYEYNGG